MYTEITNSTFTKDESKIDSPWKPYDENLRTIEMVYLIVLMVVGSLGNLLVISSIIHEKRVNKSGNIFIINLAVADLFVSLHIISFIFNKRLQIIIKLNTNFK